MARGVNKVILVGNLGRDPEVRYSPNGQAVANVTLATSESWKDKTSGEKQEKTEWHRIVFFGRLAEIAAPVLLTDGAASPAWLPAIVEAGRLPGGRDPSPAWAWGVRRQGWACHTVAFDYGQRHRVELEAAAQVATATRDAASVVSSVKSCVDASNSKCS